MNKAIFWDLLGTLGGDSKSLINEQFELFEQSVTALKESSEKDFLNIIITNQCLYFHKDTAFLFLKEEE